MQPTSIIPTHIARGRATIVSVSALYHERGLPHVTIALRGGLWTPSEVIVRGRSAALAATLRPGSPFFFEARRLSDTALVFDGQYDHTPTAVSRLNETLLVTRWSTIPLGREDLAGARDERHEAALEEGLPRITIDERARTDQSIYVGQGSPLDYPYAIPDHADQRLFRRYLYFWMRKRAGEVYAALSAIAAAAQAEGVILRPDLDDRDCVARAYVIRGAALYMLASAEEETPPAIVYAVRGGQAPGIYASRAECEARVRGVRGASYRAFASRAAAERWLQSGTLRR